MEQAGAWWMAWRDAEGETQCPNAHRGQEGKVPRVRLDDMNFRLQGERNTPGGATPAPFGVSISTDVEVPRGQQVVVGKSTYGDKAYILVMSAQFPDQPGLAPFLFFDLPSFLPRNEAGFPTCAHSG